MSHDIEAAYAAAEVANILQKHPADCFDAPPLPTELNVYAGREGRHSWPHADGVLDVLISSATPRNFNVAFEFKRPNEGLHGILTAIGQSHAYLAKGYTGSVMVVPESYSGMLDTGTYLRDVLNNTSHANSIGIYTYKKPDLKKISPFEGKLTLHRPLRLDASTSTAVVVPPSKIKTQWAHVREGSTEADAFFKYLQAVKLLSGGSANTSKFSIPASLKKAVARVSSTSDPEKYLANCPTDTEADKAWRFFWFNYVLHKDLIEGWTKDSTGKFVTNSELSKLEKSDGSGKKAFFAGKSNSIKNKLVEKLNAGTMSISDAEDALVKNYHTRAHSYREDIDSGCEHFGFVDADGRLSDDGYRFVDACERYRDPNQGLPRALMLKAVLDTGSLGAFLHYIYRLSGELFEADPLAFSKCSKKQIKFDQASYLLWLETEMENRLRVLRKVSMRAGVARKPFQAELALLRNFGIIEKKFRPGVGLVINWPELQDATTFGSDL